MKKIIALLLALTMLLLFAGCGEKEEIVEITVFAAASLQETLTELGEIYMAEHENIRIIFNFDSSGTLKTQIQEGAECDIFISAGQKQMNELNCILEGSRFDILENKVALVVAEGNTAGITSYEDLAVALREGRILLAMGNSDVPVGQYTEKILSYYGLEESSIAGCITYGSNVKEITTQLKESAVDCGIVYASDANSAGLTVVDTATQEMCGQVIYPAAMMEGCKNMEATRAFIDFLTSQIADEVFAAVGFTPIV